MSEFNEFNKYVEDVMLRYENEAENLENLVKIKSFSKDMYSLIKASLMHGKRLRAILGVISYQAAGGEVEKAIPYAVSIELAHNASLIHDDIVDNDEIRRGKAALHKEIGTGKATVLGDAMILLSINIAADHNDLNVIKLITRYGFKLCDGEFIDTSHNIETVSEEDYLLKINRKSASLFKSASHVAAVAAGGSPQEIKALSAFGENIGIIYQIKDDIADLMKVKKGKISSDLKNGIVTLPIIHFYKNSTPHEKQDLIKIFGKDHSIAAAEKLIDELVNKGSIEYCKEKIKEQEIIARNCLNDLKDSRYKRLLSDYLDYILGL